MKENLNSVLYHMIEDCEDIASFVESVSGEEEMWANKMCRKAIIMSILNLGELAKILENQINLPYDRINWAGLKGMRDIAAHKYRIMTSDIVWNVAVNEIPHIHSFLLQQLQSMNQS